MKVLFILGKYYPEPSVNGICTDNVIKEMVKSGQEVTCLVNRHVKEPEYCMKNGTHIYRVKGEYMIDLKMKIDNRGKLPKFLRFLLKVWYQIFKVIRYPFVRESFPLEDRIAVNRFYKKAAELHEKTGFDAVVAIHKPLETLYAAYKLKLRYPEIKLFPYMLDSLSGGVAVKRLSAEETFRKRRRYEQPIFEVADNILLMGSSYNHYFGLYKDTDVLKKMDFVDIPLFSSAEEAQKAEKETDGCIRIIYTGTLITPVREPMYFLETLKRINDRRFSVTIIGKCNCRELFMQYNSENIIIEMIDFVTHSELKKYFYQADMFVNFGVTFTCGISGKIFEYMSYGKPIISTYSIDDEASLPYLNKYPLSFFLDERCVDIENQAEELKSFIDKNANKIISKDGLTEIFKKNDPRYTADEIVMHIQKRGNKMKHIGIVTCYLDNFGACLQAYAIQTTLKKLDNDCKIINYTPSREINNPNTLYTLFKMTRHKVACIINNNYRFVISRKEKFDAFRKKYLTFDEKYYATLGDLKNDPPKYDVFVVGSDQLWNPIIHNNTNNKAYFLDFVPEGKKRVAYAPSIGLTVLPDEFKTEMAEMLAKFDTLSAREQAGADIVTSLTGRKCPVVLDPTLLLSKEEWGKIAAEPDINEPYILCYLFGKPDYIGEFVEYAKEKTGYEVIVIPFVDREYNSPYMKIKKVGPSEFVGLIKNAALVITDSFHATAFSINLNTAFYSLLRNTDADRNNMNSRIINILNITGLENRLIRSKNDFPAELKVKINFAETNKKIDEKRKEDTKFLRSAIYGGE